MLVFTRSSDVNLWKGENEVNLSRLRTRPAPLPRARIFPTREFRCIFIQRKPAAICKRGCRAMASRVSSSDFAIIAGKKRGSLTHLVDGAVAAVGTVLRAVGIPLRRLDHLDVRHGALDDDVVLPEVIVGLLVDHQQLGLVGERLDALDHLGVGLVRDVDLVNLDYPIALAQTGRLARRALVHLADELTVLALLRVQIEAVAVEVVPLDDVAEPSARLIVLEGGHRVTTRVGLTLGNGGEVGRGGGRRQAGIA